MNFADSENAYFAPIEAGRYRSDPRTGGPWNPALQHGGPPNALLVLAAEQAAEAETGRSDLVALRLAAEFVRPVPVADVSVTTRILRAARTVVLVGATLSAEGRTCLEARIWLVRDADTRDIATPDAPSEPPDDRTGLGAGFPYGDSLEWRVVSGGLREPGPGAAWVRADRPIVAGVPLTGLQRAALVGDSASGVSSALDWTVWSFLNIDLDIHLARPVVGDWLLLDAETQLGPSGAGLARSTLADRAGPVGGTLQTLVVEKLSRS